jgi:hypothetical protein
MEVELHLFVSQKRLRGAEGGINYVKVIDAPALPRIGDAILLGQRAVPIEVLSVQWTSSLDAVIVTLEAIDGDETDADTVAVVTELTTEWQPDAGVMPPQIEPY